MAEKYETIAVERSMTPLNCIITCLRNMKQLLLSSIRYQDFEGAIR